MFVVSRSTYVIPNACSYSSPISETEENILCRAVPARMIYD